MKSRSLIFFSLFLKMVQKSVLYLSSCGNSLSVNFGPERDTCIYTSSKIFFQTQNIKNMPKYTWHVRRRLRTWFDRKGNGKLILVAYLRLALLARQRASKRERCSAGREEHGRGEVCQGEEQGRGALQETLRWLSCARTTPPWWF
jgi:hypothetical protein